MPTKYDEVARIITAQQKGLTPETPVYTVGEQLKDMARKSTTAAELLAGDLDKSDMGIADAEKKLKAYADGLHAKQKGNCVCVTPTMADRVLREFYGIPANEPTEPVKTSSIIDLSDFF